MTHRRVEIPPVSAALQGGRRLTVHRVFLDEYAVRIEYSIQPPLPGPDDGRPPMMWFFHGEDDLGNRYQDGGGAYGPAADGSRTDGVLSLQPVPPETARRVTIRVTPWTDIDSHSRPWLEFVVTLLPALHPPSTPSSP